MAYSYSIQSPFAVSDEYFMVKFLSEDSIDCLAIVNLNVKPDRECKQVIFENKTLAIDN